jgi:hypothetical protein
VDLPKQRITVRASLLTAIFASVAIAMTCAPEALADSSQSSNWAGYAVHRSGVSFTKVIGAWNQPAAVCSPGNPTYSAVWVGLGGYSVTSPALEQIGTEMDCTASGRAVSSAWYELVPAASRTIKFNVLPGDEVVATVSVVDRKVQLMLVDETRHRTFTKTLRAAVVDVSSAEWIVEAPSECFSDNSCQTLPLADFGSTAFGLATVQSTTGHTGSISDRAWGSSRISLAPSGQHFIVYSSRAAAGSASPSSLDRLGNSFTVTYHSVVAQAPPVLNQRRQTTTLAGQLVHASIHGP